VGTLGPSAVRTGETAFQLVYGTSLFEYLAQHPGVSTLFAAGMTGNTAISGDALTRAVDWAGVKRVVDVGGGQGLLLATVLRAYPEMTGVLFDQPDVVAGAPPVLYAAGVAHRCEIVGGDFFENVPKDGDVYLLRQIIHDWDDVRARAILQNCKEAIPARGRLLVIERAMAEDYHTALPALHGDLQMLVSTGGRQRTDEEYRVLFAEAGFRLSSIVPLGDDPPSSAFEGLPT
jgi:hypothetical protein